MTTKEFVHIRLASQQLMGAKSESPADVVKWLGAVQSQDYAGAKWAVGIRLQHPSEDTVEQAFQDGKILRTHLLRPTWHFATPDDIRWLLNLTAPRVQSANAYMYRKIGLDASMLKRSRVALTRALRGGQHLTRDELRSFFQKNRILIDVDLRMTYLMMQAELDGVICSGPRRGKQFTYALLDERVPNTKTLGRDEALAELARRFFNSRGPATVHDFAKWSGLTVTDARTGLESVKQYFESSVVDGKEHWFKPCGSKPSQRSPIAHLLSVYDEYFSGYKDRSAILSHETAARLSEMSGALGYIVVDGQVVGTWKREVAKGAKAIKTSFARRLSIAEERAIGTAARAYAKFLGMKQRFE
jgi:hypothetical protein